MSKIKQLWYQYWFTAFMFLFISGGVLATAGATQVNPPENIEQVVLGNVNGRALNQAVRTGDEALLEVDNNGQDNDFFDLDFFDFDGPRNGRRGERGPRRP